MPEDMISIPKFASFKPKPLGPDPKQIEEEKWNGEHERDRRANPKHREHRHRRHRSKSREREHDRAFPSRRPPSHERQLRQEVFIIDCKGDLENLAYGSIHRYDVPTFHRFGAGRVLGAPSRTRIDRDYGDDKGLVLSDSRDSGRRMREKYIFSKVERQRPRLLKIRQEITSVDPPPSGLAYIPLLEIRVKKLKSNDFNHEDGSSPDSDTHYRSIHGKVKAAAHPDDDYLQYATESDSSGSDAGRVLTLDDALEQESVKLQQRLDESMHDIEAWLALIEHQGHFTRNGDENRRVTNAEIRSTAEIKIHMYEKALEHAKSLSDRERLLIGLMHEGSKIWEAEAQADRWEQISQENIESLALWKSYLNFKQSSFATFRYEAVRDVYVKRIKSLSEAANKTGQSSYFQHLLYVLLRFTLFVRECGYTELAVAIWQGLLEFNFRAPPNTLCKSGNIDQFQNFWESEVARIGEDAALGWRHFSDHEDASDVPAVFIDEEESCLDGRSIFKSWSLAERRRRNASRMPARTLDEVQEDDPFRVILFSDIEEFLVLLPPNSDDLHHMLLDAFLLFCRLPPVAALDQPSLQALLRDCYIHDDLLELHSVMIKKEYLEDRHDGKEETGTDLSNTFLAPLLNIPVSSDSLFAGKCWFQHLRLWRELYDRDEGPVTYRFVRNCLQQLTAAYFQEDLAELYLAFEWKNEAETIKKTVKSLLKQHPASIRLYNAYAMVEWSKGNHEVAAGVFAAALGLTKSTLRNDSHESILLWRSWIWELLEISDNSKALQLLLSIPEGTLLPVVDAGPSILLKTKQHLIANRDHRLSANNPSVATIYAELLALLTYLTSTSITEPQSTTQGDITSALTIITTFSHNLSKRPPTPLISHAHEELLLSATRLLYHHTRHGPYRPSLLRSHLTTFLNLFPSNTAFLTLYSHNESRLRISNRVRTILLSTILTPQNDTLPSRIFAIRHEIHHGTIHSVRSAFEHAVSSPATRGSAGLWKFYILWCYETPKFRDAAKEVWLRAIRSCPWSTELYIFGMERVLGIEGVQEADLRRTWRVLGEKELRVHVDLEGLFEEMDDEKQGEVEKRRLK